jgi:anti-sigma factor RsiW
MNDIGTDDHVLIRDDLEAFLDGELDDARARAVRGHLAGCEPCRHELRSLEGLGRLLLANRPAIAPSADFERAFTAAFRREARGRFEVVRPAPVAEPAPRSEGAFAWLLRPVLVPLAVATAAAAATILLRPDEAVEVAAPLAPSAIESVAADASAGTAGIELVAESEPSVEPAAPAEPAPVIAEKKKESTGAAPTLAVAADAADLVESASVDSSSAP